MKTRHPIIDDATFSIEIEIKAPKAKALIKTAPLTLRVLIIKASVVKVSTGNIMITRLCMVRKPGIGKYMLSCTFSFVI